MATSYTIDILNSEPPAAPGFKWLSVNVTHVRIGLGPLPLESRGRDRVGV